MGTGAVVTVTAGRGSGFDARLLADQARRRVHELEARWSRFLPGSEISTLNAANGRAVEVSSDTRMLIELAIEGWRLTSGSFDPTVLHSMLAIGYDRTFSEFPSDVSSSVGRAAEAPGCDLIEIGREPARVRLPRGVGFDPGGIGKGLAADLVVAELLGLGAAGACVEIGGDVRVAGDGPEGAGWVVTVRDPRSDTISLGEVWLHTGGVASSSVLRRRWSLNGKEHHHVVDPATGLPTSNGIIGSAVIAGTAWRAEVLATAACVEGTGHTIETSGAAGLLVPGSGTPRTIGDFARFTR